MDIEGFVSVPIFKIFEYLYLESFLTASNLHKYSQNEKKCGKMGSAIFVAQF